MPRTSLYALKKACNPVLLSTSEELVRPFLAVYNQRPNNEGLQGIVAIVEETFNLLMSQQKWTNKYLAVFIDNLTACLGGGTHHRQGLVLLP